MKTSPASVAAYLAALPEDRRKALSAVRAAIRKALPKGYAEGIQYGMIGWFVPHSIYPAGYHCDATQPLPFASLASQKSHMALYLFCTYLDEGQAGWFRDAWAATGKRLDMGKSCVRFKRLEDVPLDVVAEAIRRVPVKAFIECYERSVPAARKAREKTRGAAATRGATSKKPPKAPATPKSKAGTGTPRSPSAARGARTSKPAPSSRTARPKR
jgi:hypothetical protein